MRLFCDRHQTVHYVGPVSIERLVYALGCALAIAETETDPEMRPHAGERAYDHFPCPLEMLSLADSGEAYLEHVDAAVTARRRWSSRAR